MQVELIVNRRERILEFLYGFAFVFKSLLLERKQDLWGFLQAETFRLTPKPAEWESESGKDGNWDTAQSEAPNLIGAGAIQGMGLRREWVGCLIKGFDVQSDLMHEHVRIENYSSVGLETLPNHPSKGDAGETVTCTVLHRSTTNVWKGNRK